MVMGKRWVGRRSTSLTFSVLLGCAAACSDGQREDLVCPHTLSTGECVGLTRERICAEEFCVTNASCASTYYVRQGADAQGDGTAGRPFATLEEAATTEQYL